MANKVALAEAQSVVDVTTPGWDNLTGEQKRFAALYGIHHDIIRTATAAGVTLAWVQEQSKSNTNFSEVLKYGVGNTTDIGTKMMKMAIPYTVMRLLDMIENEPNNQIVLAAIKHLHDATGVNQKAQPAFGGNFLNVSVKMFGDTKENKVIDV
jgi:hypothetical protein